MTVVTLSTSASASVGGAYFSGFQTIGVLDLKDNRVAYTAFQREVKSISDYIRTSLIWDQRRAIDCLKIAIAIVIASWQDLLPPEYLLQHTNYVLQRLSFKPDVSNSPASSTRRYRTCTNQTVWQLTAVRLSVALLRSYFMCFASCFPVWFGDAGYQMDRKLSNTYAVCLREVQ